MQKIKWLCAVYFEQQTFASNVVYSQNYLFQGFNIFLYKIKKKVTKDVNFLVLVYFSIFLYFLFFFPFVMEKDDKMPKS